MDRGAWWAAAHGVAKSLLHSPALKAGAPASHRGSPNAGTQVQPLLEELRSHMLWGN